MTTAALSYDTVTHRLVCKGDWLIGNYETLWQTFLSFSHLHRRQLNITAEAIHKLDSAGATLLLKIQQYITQHGGTAEIVGLAPQQQTLLTLVAEKYPQDLSIEMPPELTRVATLGKMTLASLAGLQSFLNFIGHLTFEAFYILLHPKRMRFGALINVVYRTGFQALPIIALLSLMIGVVITYQMGLQLKTYGANIYIVDLLGIAVLREFAPLLTAIMVAGRTGSAFTAQLGIMKLNQEIDALDTLGVTPAELLLLPRIGGLILALPLLTIWSDIFGVLGGALMANNMLGLSWYDFFLRFPHVIKLKTFLIGIGKAPVFAAIIASVGCYQGMKVGQSADSVGLKTTRSVVLSIFFIIVADALFSIVFSKLKL